MAKGPIVTTEVEAFIASVYQKNPKLKAWEVRNYVDSILHKKDSKLPPGWPGLSTVQKVLAIVRKNMKETPLDTQDKPWSMGTLDEYPIPPDVIPAILEVQKFWENMMTLTGGELPLTLTIRGAKWIARLAHVIDEIKTLAIYADAYEHLERIYQYLGKPFDSHVLDCELAKPDRAPIPDRQPDISIWGKGIIKEFINSGGHLPNLGEVLSNSKKGGKTNER